MKKHNTFLLLILFLIAVNTHSQVNEINFNLQPFNSTLPPRTGTTPMSIKLLNNYGNGGPTTYGTIMEIYGMGGHQTGQLYFGGWDNSKIRYRQSFYAEPTWSSWITMLDSKNDAESEGNLKVNGQGVNYFLNSNVGIGTTAPENSEGWERVLEVKGNNHSKILSSAGTITSGLFSHGGTGYYGAPAGGITGTTTNHPFSIITNKTSKITILENGNVGVGTTDPTAKLHVAGTIIGQDFISNGINSFIFHTPDDGRKSLHIAPYENGNWNWGKEFILSDGNAALKGKLEAKEIKVTTTPTADFVFGNDYKLPTLQSVEKHIKDKKHLPEIASGTTMEKEGVNVGEFQIKLLQKIEELTLYAIEQQKRLLLLEKEIILLKLDKK